MENKWFVLVSALKKLLRSILSFKLWWDFGSSVVKSGKMFFNCGASFSGHLIMILLSKMSPGSRSADQKKTSSVGETFRCVFSARRNRNKSRW